MIRSIRLSVIDIQYRYIGIIELVYPVRIRTSDKNYCFIGAACNNEKTIIKQCSALKLPSTREPTASVEFLGHTIYFHLKIQIVMFRKFGRFLHVESNNDKATTLTRSFMFTISILFS